jgi:hypothetical protein
VIGGEVLLFIERGDGAAVAHRVQATGNVRLEVVDDRRQRAVPVKLIDMHQERVVPAADIVAAAALTAAEEAEYQKLDAQLAGTVGEARTLRRFNALRLRWLMFGSAQ